jgi:hypothetical protein
MALPGSVVVKEFFRGDASQKYGLDAPQHDLMHNGGKIL